MKAPGRNPRAGFVRLLSRSAGGSGRPDRVQPGSQPDRDPPLLPAPDRARADGRTRGPARAMGWVRRGPQQPVHRPHPHRDRCRPQHVCCPRAAALADPARHRRHRQAGHWRFRGVPGPKRRGPRGGSGRGQRPPASRSWVRSSSQSGPGPGGRSVDWDWICASNGTRTARSRSASVVRYRSAPRSSSSVPTHEPSHRPRPCSSGQAAEIGPRWSRLADPGTVVLTADMLASADPTFSALASMRDSPTALRGSMTVPPADLPRRRSAGTLE